MRVIVVGFGNPLRKDDGVAWRLIERLQATLPTLNLPIEVDTAIYIEIPLELSEKLKDYDVVLFVDAALDMEEDVEISEVEPSPGTILDSHALTPQQVLLLSKELYPESRNLKAYVLKVRAEDIGFGEELSERTSTRADLAYDTMLRFLKEIPTHRDEPSPVEAHSRRAS